MTASHASQAIQIAARIPDGFKLIDKDEQIAQMAPLVTHVYGEHLGQWENGIKALRQLKLVPSLESGRGSEQAIVRSIASLELAAGVRNSVEEFSASDRIRILAVAAAALSEQRQVDRALAIFRHALDVAQCGLPKDDPANRALAVTGNNLAGA